MKKLLLIAAALIFTATLSFGQKTVDGKVFEKSTNKVIAGANISVKEKPSVITKSGMDGKFTINVPAEGQTLVVDAPGYKRLEVLIGNKTTLEIPLNAIPPKNNAGNVGSH